MKKRIAILGSTGSIGTQALEVISAHPESFTVEVLTSNNNVELLIRQAIQFEPNAVVIGDPKKYSRLKEALEKFPVKVFAGEDALSQVMEMDSIDTVLTAVVGFAGLKPTLAAIQSGKQIALANKETLVVAGDLITRMAREKGVDIYPVDSEHSAIFQCMAGEWQNRIEKIYLTASGGPFRGKDRTFLAGVKKEDALKHPNWDMGAKITIDSASMMNKGLEMIEARWLFNLRPDQIDVVVHPQSIVHSLVQFEDGSMKAQMGLPDMKLPILYALSHPQRLKTDFTRFDFLQYPSLTFEKPDPETFRNLALAETALKRGGNLPCILNAANEVAVAAFMNDRIGFLEMSDLIKDCMIKVPFIEEPALNAYFETDREARLHAERWLTMRAPQTLQDVSGQLK